MPEQSRPPRRPPRLLASITGVALGVGILGTTATARADEPAPVYPSAGQVAAAKAAVGSAGAQVAALDARLSASRARVEELSQAAADAGEAANGAQLALDDATRASQQAAAAATAAQAKADEAQLALSRYAAEVYQSGGDTQLDVFFGEDGPQGVIDRAAGVDAVGSEQARLAQEAASTQLVAQGAKQQAAEAAARQAAAADAAKKAADAAQAAAQTAQTQTAILESQQQQMVTQLAALQRTSVQLEQQRQAGLAAAEQRRQEEARRKAAEAAARAAAAKAAAEAAARQAAAEAAERAAQTARQQAAAAAAARAAAQQAAQQARQAQQAAQQAASSPPPVVDTPNDDPAPVVNAPAPSGGVSSVIAFARAQLGEQYVWGGAGPNVWDCSGLTMMAWRQAGVSMAHYTGSQYNQTARVPISQLQPGDLVFYGVSGPSSHHVGLYIGGGRMIHAPNPSTVVKIASIYSMSDLLPYGGRPG